MLLFNILGSVGFCYIFLNNYLMLTKAAFIWLKKYSEPHDIVKYYYDLI